MIPAAPTVSRAHLRQLRAALQRGNKEAVLASLQGVEAADAAELISQLPPKSCLQALQCLAAETAAQIISFLDEDVLHTQLREMPVVQLVDYLPHLASDDAADLLMMFPADIQQQVLRQLPEGESTQNIEELLRYEEDTAGSLMAKELISCQLQQSIADCRKLLRTRVQSGIGKFFVLYVVNDTGILLGVLTLSTLSAAEDHVLVKELYDDEPITATPYMHKKEIAHRMRKYDLETLPVLSSRGRLLGRITVDDVLDVQEELAEKEHLLMAGVAEHLESHQHPWRMLWARLPWLLVGLLGGLLAARLMAFFEADLMIVPALLFFIPMLTATAGNVGIQSALSIVQTFAHEQRQGRWLWQLLWRLWWTALLCAGLLAVLVAGSVLLAFQTLRLSIIVGVSLCVTILAAALLGTLIPLLLRRLGMNPALATGPLLTALNDLLGIAIYLGLVRILHGPAV